MKKIILLSGLTLLTLASCKKDWTCTCTSTSSLGTFSSSATIADMKKSDAKAECDSGDATASGVTVDCELN
jgi:hypothetical protein